MSSQPTKVNKCFKPALLSQDRYLVLVGGSGSGKSVFASQKILFRLISEERHRILVVRKVAGTLRESVFKRFKNEISDMGLTAQFSANQTNMSFTHIATGNEIIMSGLDDVEKLKSIEKVTSIWVEEATEMREDDLDQLDLRLRGETASYKQIILTFNPVDENHWLKKRFFDNKPDNCFSLKTTFKDNAFIDDEYRRVLEQKAILSPNIYRIYYLGEWGKEDIESPYAINFKREKHVSKRAQYDPQRQIIFSLDFNVTPFVCICAHVWLDGKGHHLHVFDEVVIEKNGDVHAMCELLLSIYGAGAMANALFTGDATSRKKEITQQENMSAWRIIDSRLRLGKRLKLPPANPSVKENRHLINSILAYHPDIAISPDCTKLVYDLQFVEADDNGDILKKNRSDERQRSDALDCFRYLCNTFLPDFYEKYRIK